jgi:predicted amidohydrolase YtcJ
VRAIKRQIDGALGSRGAWLLEPYSDKPDSAGLNTTSIADIAETARLAMANDYQLCVHAIGDRANRETLNIFEQAFKAGLGMPKVFAFNGAYLFVQDIPRFASSA